jgi:hypothetical protein
MTSKPFVILNTGKRYETYSGAISGVYAYMRSKGVESTDRIRSEATTKQGVVQYHAYAKDGHFVACLLDARETLVTVTEPKPEVKDPFTTVKMFTVYETLYWEYSWEIRVWDSANGRFGMNVRLGTQDGAHETFTDVGPWKAPMTYASEKDAVRDAERMIEAVHFIDDRDAIVLVRK